MQNEWEAMAGHFSREQRDPCCREGHRRLCGGSAAPAKSHRASPIDRLTGCIALRATDTLHDLAGATKIRTFFAFGLS
jgi:hypothetical protein